MARYQSKVSEVHEFVVPRGREDRRAMLREGLLAMSVQLGLSEFAEIMEAEAAHVAGPKGRPQQARTANHWGTAIGSVVLGGRRVGVKRPRVRTRTGEEIALASYETVRQGDPLDAGTLEKMLAGVATRQYERTLDSVGEKVRGNSTSRSAVSRRLVKATGRALAGMMGQRLDDVHLVAVILDALYVAKHAVIAALGVDQEGRKRPLGLWEGATENATVVKALLSNLADRGLDISDGCLFVIDGSKALRKAITDTFGEESPIQRCRVHKERNLAEHLPHEEQVWVKRKFRDAMGKRSAEDAKAALVSLAHALDVKHPGAAASLREGMDDLLTTKRLGIPEMLDRTFSTTNPLESAFSRSRGVCRNVKRWRSGSMILRWHAAGLAEAGRTFRRIKGHREIPFLIAALARRKEALARKVA